jgi:hypothetical protein
MNKFQKITITIAFIFCTMMYIIKEWNAIMTFITGVLGGNLFYKEDKKEDGKNIRKSDSIRRSKT